MADVLKIAPELRARVDALAARAGMTVEQVVTDALNGHSLEWQETFVAKVEAGRIAADAGDFASPAEVERVRNKYRPT